MIGVPATSTTAMPIRLESRANLDGSVKAETSNKITIIGYHTQAYFESLMLYSVSLVQDQRFCVSKKKKKKSIHKDGRSPCPSNNPVQESSTVTTFTFHVQILTHLVVSGIWETPQHHTI